jgi:hypothetical protein
MSGYHDTNCHKRCISWTAVITGALVCLGLTFLFNLFNIAIGVTVLTMTIDGPTLMIGGFLALLLSTIVAMFTGGYVAGFLGRTYCAKRNTGVIYGFATWTLALILTAFISTHVGRFVYTYSHFVTDPTTIVITTDNATPAVSTKTNDKNVQPTEVIINVDKTKTSIGMGAFILFLLFAIGALFTCLGGACGMSCCSEPCSRDESMTCGSKKL